MREPQSTVLDLEPGLERGQQVVQRRGIVDRDVFLDEPGGLLGPLDGRLLVFEQRSRYVRLEPQAEEVLAKLPQELAVDPMATEIRLVPEGSRGGLGWHERVQAVRGPIVADDLPAPDSQRLMIDN